MTKRTNKPKATSTVAPTINSTPTKQAVESDKAETKAKVATKPKTPTKTAQKTTAKPRGRSKKIVGEPTVEINLPAPVSKVVDVDSRTITYASAGNAVPSKYGQFKAWLVFKLYVVTSYFRGF